MEKYPFYDIVLFIAILSNVLFMSIAIIIIRTKKTSRKNSQILHKVMQLPVDEEKERSYTILEEIKSENIGFISNSEWEKRIAAQLC